MGICDRVCPNNRSAIHIGRHLVSWSGSQHAHYARIADGSVGDEERGKAVSIVYGLAGLVMLPLFAVNAWLATLDSGWRYAFFAAGILSVISGLGDLDFCG